MALAAWLSAWFGRLPALGSARSIVPAVPGDAVSVGGELIAALDARAFLTAQHVEIARAHDFAEPHRIHGARHRHAALAIGPQRHLGAGHGGAVGHQRWPRVEPHAALADGGQRAAMDCRLGQPRTRPATFGLGEQQQPIGDGGGGHWRPHRPYVCQKTSPRAIRGAMERLGSTVL